MYCSKIIHDPIAVRSSMAMIDESCLPKNPVIIVPEKAAKKEMKNVMTEIQIFIKVVIFIPRML
jgi:hypothetical protein